MEYSTILLFYYQFCKNLKVIVRSVNMNQSFRFLPRLLCHGPGEGQERVLRDMVL